MRFWTRREVPGTPLVSMVIAAYTRQDPRLLDALLCLVYCLRAQTYSNWEAIIVHDGPNGVHGQTIDAIGDARLRWLETPERKQQHGHPWRAYGISLARGDYIGLSNGDNYYVPVYFEAMLNALLTHHAQFAYCDMIHSHREWQPYPTEPHSGRLDLGAWVANAELVKATPWTDMGFNGDGTFIEALVARAAKLVKLENCLFVHC
jgi:hypothetical protein